MTNKSFLKMISTLIQNKKYGELDQALHAFSFTIGSKLYHYKTNRVVTANVIQSLLQLIHPVVSHLKLYNTLLSVSRNYFDVDSYIATL